MATRILKYRLNVDVVNSQKLKLPLDSIFLKAHNQDNNIYLWFEVDEDKPLVEEHFITLHTGDFLPSNPKIFLDTVFLNEYFYVVHIYKLK